MEYFQDNKNISTRKISFLAFLLVGTLLFSISFISSSPIAIKQKWVITKIDGAEKELYSPKIINNQVCVIMKNKDLSPVVSEKEVTPYPAQLKLYSGVGKSLVETRGLKQKQGLISRNRECFDLDKNVGYYQIGENSIIIQLTNSYSIFADKVTGRECTLTGNESYLWTCEVSIDRVTLTPISPTLDDIFNNETKLTYSYPNFFTMYVGQGNDKEQIVNIPLNLGTLNAGKFSQALDPYESYYQLFDNPILISPTTTYDTVDVNVTQENQFAHLNVSDPNLLLYYPFDVPDGNATWVAGNNSGALFFDGVDDYVPTTLDIPIEQNFSFSFWFNSSDVASTYSTIMRSSGFGVLTRTDNIRVWNFSSGQQKTCASTVSNNTWYYFTLTYDANNDSVNCYVNGVLRGTLDNYQIPAQTDIYLSYSSQLYWGELEEVRIFNRTINTTEITSLYSHVVLDRNELIGEWLLNEGTGLTARDTARNENNPTVGYGTPITYDYTNNSNDGTITNGVYQNYTGGRYSSGAYEFDGVDDYVSISDGSFFNLSTGTLSLWFKVSSGEANAYIFGRGDVTTTSYWVGMGVGSLTGGFPDESLCFANNDGGYTLFMCATDGNTAFIDDAWHHAVIVIDGINNSIYVDGVYRTPSFAEGGINTSSFMENSQTDNILSLGRRTFSSSPVWVNGSIDEVMIFNRSLSATEINQIYNSTYPRFYNTGEMLFENLNFGTNNTVNVSIPLCQQLNGSQLSFKINDGSYSNLDGTCSANSYRIEGDLSSANFTLRFNSTPFNFYSPVLYENITFGDYFTPTWINPNPIYGTKSCFGYNYLPVPSWSNCTR